MSTPDARVVLMTTPDGEVAQRIARALVEERLAACVNLLPGVRSIYRFEPRGRIHVKGKGEMEAYLTCLDPRSAGDFARPAPRFREAVEIDEPGIQVV